MLRKEVWEVEATILTLNPFPTKGGGLFFACFAYLNLLQSRAQDLYHNKEIEGGGHRDLPPQAILGKPDVSRNRVDTYICCLWV